MNNYNGFNKNISFGEQYQGAQVITKPIEHVENFVNTTVDTFIPQAEQTEEKRKSNKTAIKVVSTVGVLGALVMLLNPRFLGAFSNKMKSLAAKSGTQSKANDTILGKVFGFGQKTFDNVAKFFNALNNLNTTKDEFFKWLCTQKKDFSKIKNETFRNLAEKFDRGFVKIMKKPHKLITKWFDTISKQTVFNKYNKINKEMNMLEEILTKYKEQLSPSERIQIQARLDKIKDVQKFFAKDAISSRLKHQEELMSGLEKKTKERITEFGHTMLDKNTNRTQYLNKNMDFWAESIVMPERNKIEKEGLNVVNSLIGDSKGTRGAYSEILDILAPHIKKEESVVLEGKIRKLGKHLKSANKSECIEYFDKKRDLILGSAPTDILTALGGLAFSGVMIGTADDGKERLSRAVTLAFPVVAGLGVSMATAAMLYSGTLGLAVGGASSLGLSRMGSSIDKKFITKNSNSNKEASNA